MCMVEIRTTNEFVDWLNGLRDLVGRSKILVRIQRLAAGNPGDVKTIGEGISELRIMSGPGYRVYYKFQNKQLIIILAGGDKKTQNKDIERAKKLSKNL